MRNVFSRLTSRTVFSGRAFFSGTFALAGAMLALTPAQVSAAPGGYNATLQQALAAPKQGILGDVLWKCAGDNCTAANAGSRPVVMCQRVAKKFGTVARFTAAGAELSADDLTKCNAK